MRKARSDGKRKDISHCGGFSGRVHCVSDLCFASRRNVDADNVLLWPGLGVAYFWVMPIIFSFALIGIGSNNGDKS